MIETKDSINQTDDFQILIAYPSNGKEFSVFDDDLNNMGNKIEFDLKNPKPITLPLYVEKIKICAKMKTNNEKYSPILDNLAISVK